MLYLNAFVHTRLSVVGERYQKQSSSVSVSMTDHDILSYNATQTGDRGIRQIGCEGRLAPACVACCAAKPSFAPMHRFSPRHPHCHAPGTHQ